MQLTKYERRLKKCLNQDIPKPKYQLWQNIEYKDEHNNAQITGEIRGLCFYSVELALHHFVDFGWVYTVCDGVDSEGISRYHSVSEHLITKAID
jgi:hypothetical protein